MYMDATLHWEAMHIQNPAAGGLPGQRSLLFCYRHGARVRKFGYFILSPDHPTTTPFWPTARPHLATPLAPFAATVATTSSSSSSPSSSSASSSYTSSAFIPVRVERYAF